jgi:vacuolar-type H+-ATPase subunit H
MKTIKLRESDVQRLVNKVLKEQEMEQSNYMFFSNLKQMRRQIDMMLEMNPNMIDDIIENGHDWADDHISEAKTNIDQVFDFFKNQMDKESQYVDYEDIQESNEITEKTKKNVPTNPSLWKKSLSWAKSRYKVCPSAYCNGAAAKHYKSLGGKWKKE